MRTFRGSGNGLADFGWTGLTCAVALLSLALWFSPWQVVLSFSSSDWLQRPWTLWTSALVHGDWQHLAANLCALFALGVLGAMWRIPDRTAWAMLVAWPLGALGLLAWPQPIEFYGLSGLNHTLAAALALQATRERQGGVWPLVLLIFLAVKLVTEQAWLHPVVSDSSWPFPVVVAVHLSGAAAGAAVASVSIWVARPVNQGRR